MALDRRCAGGGAARPVWRVTLIVDAAPLVALGDSRDRLHDAIGDLLRAEDGDLVVPAPVSAEVDYLIRDAERVGCPGVPSRRGGRAISDSNTHRG